MSGYLLICIFCTGNVDLPSRRHLVQSIGLLSALAVLSPKLSLADEITTETVSHIVAQPVTAASVGQVPQTSPATFQTQ